MVPLRAPPVDTPQMISRTRFLLPLVCVLMLLTGARADEYLPPIATGGVPGTIAIDPIANRIYVADASAAKIYVINGRTHAVERTFTPDAPCQHLAVDPVRHRLFAAQNAVSDC